MSLKKFLSAVTAVTLGLTLTFGAPVAQAASSGGTVGSLIGGIIEGLSLKSQLRGYVKQLNETPEGQQKLYDDLREQKGVDDNPEYNARLDAIMANLTAGVAAVDPTIKDFPYRYFVAADDSLNAACTMGHVMLVNRGTFKVLTSEDEIAAVVGHEMGHGQKNHVAKGVENEVNNKITAKLISAALGSDMITSTISGIALAHTGAHKDKKFETQADLLSIDYLVNTPYNIGATAAVMQKFVEMSIGTKRSQFDALFNPSDHPDSVKRRDACAKKIFEYSGKHANVKDGVVLVNGKTFMTPVASATMSGAERSYFVLGNLARAFHDGRNKQAATVVDGTVMLGRQTIVTPVAGDEDAQTLADRLNAIK